MCSSSSVVVGNLGLIGENKCRGMMAKESTPIITTTTTPHFCSRRLLLGFVVLGIFYGLIIVDAATTTTTTTSVENNGKPISRISFGSCSNQTAPQPIWDAVLRFDPDLFIWLGDNIYADSKKPRKFTGKGRNSGPWKNTPRFFQVTAAEMEHQYQLMKNVSGYVKLREQTEVIGTWDDHDFGLNDAGKELEGKQTSQKLMLDFLDEPLDSPRRRQEGVYTSYTYGPAGRQIKVILLDTRYHRDPIGSDGTMLGDAQWQWFENELRNSSAQIHIIGSSIQVVANFSAMSQPFFSVESWNLFPKERMKLYDLLQETNVSGVMFISGDVHFGEIARYDCGLSYPLYDFTSSGITQGVEELAPPPLSYILAFASWITPNTLRVYNPRCRYHSCVYGKQNFGGLEINWDADPVAINVDIRDVHGVPVLGTSFTLNELQPGYQRVQPPQHGQVQRHCTLEIELPWHQRYLLAILFFGTLIGLILIYLVIGIISVIKRRSTQKPKPD
ncbi:unnamed protein product [Sphagnum balticum]